MALESHESSEDGLLHFEQGDVILVLSDSQQDGLVRGIKEEDWTQHGDVENHSGNLLEKLVQRVETEWGSRPTLCFVQLRVTHTDMWWCDGQTCGHSHAGVSQLWTRSDWENI